MAQAIGSLELEGAYPPRLQDLRGNRARHFREGLVRVMLMAAAAVSILTTIGILISLIGETILFFQRVPIIEFVTDTEWTPLFSIKKFGIWPLVTATLMISVISLLIAVPLGLLSATLLSEFASPRVRDVIKPLLEILSGIPTVVYGYFALTFVTPIFRQIIPDLSVFNALSAGIVMGVMLIPLISSLSEDAMAAVPNELREGAYGLGATRFEVAVGVVFPAALSGIVASVILALSRAVGETMIVAIAAGQTPAFTFDPRQTVETMTAFIVQVSLGDTPHGSLEYQTLFAVGTTLFAMTFALNQFSHWFVRRFREVYD
jgi:phosphate transport system permease protein